MQVTTPEFSKILSEAISEPGKLHACYSVFHDYSILNGMLAAMECRSREIPLGPINTYKGWLALGRHVVKGQKAISLIMPVSCKANREKTLDDGSKENETVGFTRFILRPNWFVLAQTEGETYTPNPIPEWDGERALQTLGITKESFADTDGNTQGYAKPGHVIAVSPLAALPHKTQFHEVAHVLLGHLEQGALSDSETTPKNLREVEAESVAYVCCTVLGLPGLEYSRGYIQHWLTGSSIPDKSAQRIFSTANAILKAGQ